MNFEYKHLLDNNFHADSRVWIYQSNRLFSINEALEIEETLIEFVRQWNSHGTPVKGKAYLFFGQFIILMADETATGVSGCSTDSSVRMIRGMEKEFGVDLFDRLNLAFLKEKKIEVLPMTQVNYALEHGFISGDTLYFNNTVSTKKELEEDWMIPVKNSWVGKKISF